MVMTKSMYACLSDVPTSMDEEINRLRILQRAVSDNVGRFREQEALSQKFSKALKEAFSKSYNANKKDLEQLIKKRK